jgi:hypothetical protein
MSAQVVENTSIGRISVTFAYNAWVLVEAPGGYSAQRQIRRQSELAQVLRELGLTGEEAEQKAATVWASRPRDAALRDVDPDESHSMFRPRTIALALLVAIAIPVYWIWNASNFFD